MEKYSLKFRVCNWIYGDRLRTLLYKSRYLLYNVSYYNNVHKFHNSIWESRDALDKILLNINCVTNWLHCIMKSEYIINGDYTSKPFSLRFRICNLIYGDQLRNVLAVDMAALYDIHQHLIRLPFNEDIPESYLDKVKEVSKDIVNIMYEKGEL